jgi:nickel/cobalt exporter
VNAKLRLLSLLVLGLVVALGVTFPARPAAAHPLGNFSVNQLEQLELRPDRVDVAASLDLAELPTLQDKPKADRDGDGRVDPGYPRSVCADLARDFDVTVAGHRVNWTVGQEQARYVRGSAGLDTTRLSCRLTAPAKLASDATVGVSNRFRADRVGWRELTATGHGVHLPGSPLPARTVSAGLLSYPQDLLSSPLDVRSAQLKVVPGDAPSSAQTRGKAVRSSVATRRVATRWTVRAEGTLRELTARHRLTPLVGVLAVLLALTLGAGHAVLPGHGKTAIAIALAGRAGRIRDAALIAGTVTLTHTGGVLALGLLLTSAAAVAGETVLGWLGVASGVLLAGVGAAMLVAGRRHHHHDHRHHDHDGAHQHRSGRLALVGIGLAGGLVPSPSALIVLLGAVGLGRTVFGVLLVVGYGVGMAATLTGAGVTLVVLRERWARRAKRGEHRSQALLARLSASAPTATAVLVLLVGCGLGARALIGLGSS